MKIHAHLKLFFCIGLMLATSRCSKSTPTETTASSSSFNINGQPDDGYFANYARNLRVAFQPVCSGVYADADHAGTSLEDAPGLAIHLYRLESVSAFPLYSVISKRIDFPSVLSADKLKAFLLANSYLDLPMGNLADGFYFLSLCSSSEQFAQSCIYQPGETILSRLSPLKSGGTGMLLVANGASAPIIVKVSQGVPSLLQFDPRRGFNTMSLLMSSSGCAN